MINPNEEFKEVTTQEEDEIKEIIDYRTNENNKKEKDYSALCQNCNDMHREWHREVFKLRSDLQDKKNEIAQMTTQKEMDALNNKIEYEKLEVKHNEKEQKCIELEQKVDSISISFNLEKFDVFLLLLNFILFNVVLILLCLNIEGKILEKPTTLESFLLVGFLMFWLIIFTIRKPILKAIKILMNLGS